MLLTQKHESTMTTTQIAKNSTGLHIEGNLIAGDYLADLVIPKHKEEATDDIR